MSVEKDYISVSISAKTQLAHIYVIAMMVLCLAMTEHLVMVRNYYLHYCFIMTTLI